MVKKAGGESTESHSTSAKTLEKEQVLKSNSTEKMKRTSTRLSRASEKENNPISPKNYRAKPQKKVAKEDPNKPKKPPTAFFYFLEDFRSEYQAQNPDVKQMRDVGKACGEKWKTMKYEEKVKYYDIATEKRAEFDRAIAEYNKRNKETGKEDPDDLEDPDF